jgi:hypothetical protein
MDDMEGPITSVPRLLAPHDRQFLQAAYQALLGRPPDRAGEAFYLAQLRAGQHKLAILKQLRQSDEGRAFVPGVAGLDRAIKRHRLATLPVVGALIRLFTGWEGNGALQRQLRIMANELGRMHAQQAAMTNASQQPALLPRPAMPAPVLAPAALPTPQSLQRPASPVGDSDDAPSSGSWGRAMDSKEQRLLEILRQSALRRGMAA